MGSIPLGIRMSGEELQDYQSQHSQHITFNLTESCPLRCSHCIISTVPASDHSRTIPMWRAETYAEQLPALARRGIRFISFTGGEPLLARRQLKILSQAAQAVGIECHVVTACHWATSEANAERVVESFPGLTCWHVSTDVFHSEYVSVDNVMRAAAAATKLGREVVIRLSLTTPETPEMTSIFNLLRESLPNVPIIAQPIIGMGRGASVVTELETADVPAFPCIPTGMVVRFDGTVSPCCGGLVDTREGHPFQYPSPDSVGLDEAHRIWCTDPLIQLIRAVGFAPLIPWLEEIAPDNRALKDRPRHPCEFCVRMWSDPSVGEAVRERISRGENRTKVAHVVREVFGETFMQEEPAGTSSGAIPKMSEF
jgi:pyruvate-formate lyase-activating enzyme